MGVLLCLDLRVDYMVILISHGMADLVELG